MLWLVVPALAQVEVCSPQPLRRWQQEVEAAEVALQEMRIRDATQWLDDAHDVARCVVDVIPETDVRHYAQLRTLEAFYQQDGMLVETWGFLALSLGEAPWPMDENHPLHRMLAKLEPPQPVVVEGKVLAPPKRGGVFVDGTWRDLPAAVPETYHLVQVFDADGERQLTYWQDGIRFREQLLREGPPPPPPKGYARPEEGPVAREMPDWRLARKDSLKAYGRYLDRHPDGEHVAYARRRVDDLTWEATEKTPTGARAYLDTFPKGRNRGAAEGVLQGAEFRQALDEGSTEALQLFVGKYPDGLYAGAARRQLDERAWVDALMTGSEEAYARYRVRWPQGAHFEEARIAQDELAWQAAEGRGRKAVEAYIKSWPGGGHVREARAYLDGLTFQTVRIDVSGNGPEVAHLQAEAVARDELQAVGFEVVTEGEAEAVLELVVDELDVGEGLGRWITLMKVNVEGSSEPLAESELLQDPAPMRDALADLAEGLRPQMRRLAKFRRKP